MRVTAFSVQNNIWPPLLIFLIKAAFFVLFSYTLYAIINLYIYMGVVFLNTERIRHLLLGWYSDHFRALPWRVDATPYHVWISEIMLQQTRIEAVLPYYHRFIDVLPDVYALADISPEVLLKLWEGLGYYSRARNLQKAAKIIVEKYDGQIPSDYEALLALPGIGAYTAGAIASIAFDTPVPAVDGNVMRVLARLTGDDTDVLSTQGKKRFSDLAWELVPQSNPGRFNQALMELGETVCVPSGAPHCKECPLNSQCVAFRTGVAADLPVRVKKTKRRIEKRSVAMVRLCDGEAAVLLHRRDDTGLLAGMWELPNALSDQPLAALDPSLRDRCSYIGELPEGRHLFTHIEWQMTGRLYEMTQPVALPDGYAWVTLAQLRHTFPLPSAFRVYTRILEQLLHKEK